MKLNISELQEVATKKVEETEEKSFAWADEQICNKAKDGSFWVRLNFESKVRCSAIQNYINQLNERGFTTKFESKTNRQILVEWYVEE